MAQGFTIDLLVELVRAGVATAKAERVVVGGRQCPKLKKAPPAPERGFFSGAAIDALGLVRAVTSWFRQAFGLATRRQLQSGVAGLDGTEP